MRKIFYDIHLYLGIFSAIILFIVCLTGCIYVFKPDIEKWLQPETYYVSSVPNTEKIHLDSLVERLENEQETRIVGLSLHDDPRRTLEIRMEKPEKKTEKSGENENVKENGNGREKRGENPGEKEKKQSSANPSRPPRANVKTLYLDPYTGEIVAESPKRPGSGFFMFIMRLHRFLLLPPAIGRPLVGIATLVFIVLLLSGVVLWSYTAVKNWKIGLGFRFKKGGKILLYDLHNSLGFYMLVPMLIMALTGLCWSFSWYRTAVGTVLQDKVFAARGREALEIPRPDPDLEFAPVSISDWLEKLEQQKPGRGDIEITFPKTGSNRAITLQKGGYGFFAFAIKDRFEFNPSTGEVVLVERFAEKPLGSKICVMIKALHLGDVLGPGSRIFFFLACLVATSLPVSGVLLWIGKLKAKSRARKKAVLQET